MRGCYRGLIGLIVVFFASLFVFGYYYSDLIDLGVELLLWVVMTLH